MDKSDKPWYKKWWAILLFVFVGLAIIGSFLPDDSSEKTIYVCPDGSQVYDSNQCKFTPPQDVESNLQKATIDESKQIETTSTQKSISSSEEQSDEATMGEKNALSQALSYLRYTSFSYNGLINQLEYEGYSNEEATYGVDNCGADWNEQAALKAQSYLDYSAFSKEGLINQLEYEGFTKEQAEYGVQAVGY